MRWAPCSGGRCSCTDEDVSLVAGPAVMRLPGRCRCSPATPRTPSTVRSRAPVSTRRSPSLVRTSASCCRKATGATIVAGVGPGSVRQNTVDEFRIPGEGQEDLAGRGGVQRSPTAGVGGHATALRLVRRDRDRALSRPRCRAGPILASTRLADRDRAARGYSSVRGGFAARSPRAPSAGTGHADRAPGIGDPHVPDRRRPVNSTRSGCRIRSRRSLG
jgi:hypothetical protein